MVVSMIKIHLASNVAADARALMVKLSPVSNID